MMWDKITKNPQSSFVLPAHPTGAVGRISRSVYKQLKSIATISPKATLGVACSGGADSLSLAATVIALVPRLGLKAVAAIIDHGWRPESGAEAEVVKKRLQKLGYQDVSILKLQMSPFSSSPKKNLGLEGDARSRRYQTLEAWLKNYGQLGKDAFLLLGHTRDDQAESVLLGLARGSGAGSLKGMVDYDPQTGYCRPLLEISRQDIEMMCQEYELLYLRDPSNYLGSTITTKKGTPLLRTALRHQVLPVLSASLGLDVRVPLAKTAKRMQADEEALNWLVKQKLADLMEESKEFLRTIENDDGKDVKKLPPTVLAKIRAGQIILLIKTDILKTMPGSLRKRIWHALCLKAGSPGGRLKMAQIDLIDNLVMRNRTLGPIDISGKIQIQRIPGQPFIYFYPVP